MREILFRGRSSATKEWFEGDLNHCENGVYICDLNGNFVLVDSETIGEYTGLTDKNGIKIFEGDIFKFPDEVWESSYTPCGTEWDSWEVENYGAIGFDEDTARFDFVQYRYNENSVEADLHENNCLEFAEFVKELEIIGNIHDNPELLKGAEKE